MEGRDKVGREKEEVTGNVKEEMDWKEEEGR